MRGLSLVETVVAGLILSMLMLFIFHLFPGATLAVHRAGAQLQADNLAQDRLDRARAGLVLAPTEAIKRRGVEYTIVTQVQAVEDFDLDLLKAVVVTVSWQERGKRHRVVHEAWLQNLGR